MNSYIDRGSMGHHVEVRGEVLAQRLKDARENVALYRLRFASAYKPTDRALARGLYRQWEREVEVIERETRRRSRLAAV